MVETAKRILTKEKIDTQVAGQSSFTPFMSIKNSHNNKKVTFDTQDRLEEKTDRLTVNQQQKMMKQKKNSSGLKYIKVKKEANQEISTQT